MVKIAPHYLMLLIGALLGLLGLGVPPFSSAAIVFVFLLLVIGGFFFSAISINYILLVLLLFLSVFLHQVTGIYNGIFEFSVALKNILFSVICYSIGYTVARSLEKSRGGVSVVLLAGMFGFLALGIVSAVDSGFLVGGRVILVGFARNIFNGDPIHKTHMGMYASLGMVLFPWALVSIRNNSSSVRAAGAIGLLFSIVGVAMNVATQNRTPFIAMGFTCIIVYVLFLIEKLNVQKVSVDKVVFSGISASLILAALVMLFFVFEEFMAESVFYAFTKGKLDTPRYLVWKTMIEHFGDYFWGGRKIVIPEYFAHNFWLDVLWDSGVLSFLAYLGFSVLHLWFLARVLFGKLEFWVRLLVASLGISIHLSFLVEPITAASAYYFWYCMLYFGVVGGLNARLRVGAA
jgi:hypothetical protein